MISEGKGRGASSGDHKEAVREVGRRLKKDGTVKSRKRERFQGMLQVN